MTPATPWPVVVTAEPMHAGDVLPHADVVITIPCSRLELGADQPLGPTWLELLGQR
jgi:hypothetical protein